MCGYETTWIRDGLQSAAQRADREDFPFLEDIYDSIVHYMEHKCPLRLLPIENLLERISYMLKRIGMEHIARALPAMAPPITISLEESAHAAGDNFELGFFTTLKQEISEAKKAGAAALVFDDVKESVCILTNKQAWDQCCEELEAEILSYLQRLGEKPKQQAQGRRIHIPLGHAKV